MKLVEILFSFVLIDANQRTNIKYKLRLLLDASTHLCKRVCRSVLRSKATGQVFSSVQVDFTRNHSVAELFHRLSMRLLILSTGFNVSTVPTEEGDGMKESVDHVTSNLRRQ